MVTPPDGRAIFDRMTGGRSGRQFGSRRFGSQPTGRASRAGGAGREDIYGAGADTRWFDQEWENIAPSTEELEGAVGMTGRTTSGEVGEAFETLLSEGPYQAILIPEGHGVWGGNADQFIAEKADQYLNPKMYPFKGRGEGLDAEIDPMSLDPSTIADPEERKAVEDAQKRLTVADVSSVGKWPAPITNSPTTTTNPKRPRTVAAGYDGYRNVLTVVFRDGTYYNYYGVSALEWGAFLSRKSKGQYIAKFLDGKVRGYADTASMPRPYRDLLYRVSRTAQAIRQGGKRR
jgi:hypothetical protein